MLPQNFLDPSNSYPNILLLELHRKTDPKPHLDQKLPKILPDFFFSPVSIQQTFSSLIIHIWRHAGTSEVEM